MKTLLRYFLAIFLISLVLPFYAQTIVPETKLPEDPDVLTGKLENGLKYYIRHNVKPEKRIEFRMVLNAGSILEDDDQQGLAHFLEHMAFNGSEDFSKNDLVDFLEESGLDFGADLNAYTSFDETVYMFQMPSDRSGLVDSAFIVLENWAHKLSLDEEEIDKERGVVHEEWRLGLGANDRMMKKYIPIILKDSRYAVRLPIGKMSVIDSCDYEAVERFYNDWYRPDLMAIIVVGDIDPEFAETKIKEHFSKIKGPETERPRVEYNIPDNDQPLIAIATDKEATNTMASLIRKLPKIEVVTEDNYVTMLKLDMFVAMLNARLYEITQDPEAPFVYSGSGYGGFLARTLDAFSMYAMVKDNQVNEAIVTMMLENKRVKRYGFTQAELDRQKSEMLSNIDKALEEKDKTDSRRFVSEYVRNFLEDEPFPGIEYEAELTRKYVPEITLDEVNQMSYYIGKQNNLVILITAPDKEEVIIPTEAEIFAAIEEAGSVELEAYKEEEVGASLITGVLTPGIIASESENADFGTTELLLDNGIRVILKPTEFKNDEILMEAYHFGGTSMAPDDEFLSASLASQIISNSGVGEFDNIALNKYLTGKNVSVNPTIGDLSQGISGKSVNKDLETMFQLTHLYFTQARKDSVAFQAFMAQMISQFKFMMSNPQAVFYDTLYKLATQNDPRTIVIPSEKQLNSVDLDLAHSFFESRFRNAAGFTFVFVGSFEVETIKPLITKYLGSLPSSDLVDNWRDVSPEFPKGITDEVVYKGTEPQSRVALMMDNSFEWNTKSRLTMSMLMKILSIRMRESMREDQGGVYGVSARPNISKYPKEEVNIMISFGCAPENVDQLVKTVFAEMDTLKMNGPEAINIGKAKETSIRDYETNFERNNYWLRKLKNTYYYGDKLKNLEELKEAVNSVTAEDIREMAKTYFTEDHYLKLVLMPEETE